MRVVLFIPNSRWFDKRAWGSIPYAALILTALLRDFCEFAILDANGDNLDEEGCRRRLEAMAPQMLLISALSVEYHRHAHKALAIARHACPAATTIMGGAYATTLPEEALNDPNVDWLFMYHAEERIVPFLQLVSDNPEQARSFPGVAYRDDAGRQVINPPVATIGDVKVMVKPDYSLFDVEKYLHHRTMDYQLNSDRPTAFIITSYGCPYNCVFCASRTLSGRRIVFRPLADVLEEIEYLKSQYRIENIIFVDDALLADRARITELLQTFIERNYNLTWKAVTVSAWHLDQELLELMARSGCTQITVSVESGSQRVLDEVIRKPLRLETVPALVRQCRSVGIAIGANFVIGVPGETWEEIRQTFRFAEACDFDVAHFHIATPLPRTDLYQICKDRGYLPEDFSFLDPKFFGYGTGFIATDEFTPFELMVLRAFEWDRINFSTPEKMARVARMYGITADELTEHRRQTRRKMGVHF
ncbi:putative methyltransferase [Geobacter sp. OR-1]|uniref:B12-binding domain-containing radical SAM protein n=1 Tax=Geobacter sp. OR-1 TaxID=1266765 RepID=UPI00054331F9|nr:radical SAM protein [Geobacter sp. OR-1]GAM10561.1 putative methyltransferase [Geobacter sp. OR-1]